MFLKICNKFTGEHPTKLLCNFIEITLRHRCSPVNLLHIFKKPFATSISGRLLLHFRNNSEDINFWKRSVQKQMSACTLFTYSKFKNTIIIKRHLSKASRFLELMFRIDVVFQLLLEYTCMYLLRKLRKTLSFFIVSWYNMLSVGYL